MTFPNRELFDEYRISILQDEKDDWQKTEVGGGDGYTPRRMYLTSPNHLKNGLSGKFTLGVFHHKFL